MMIKDKSKSPALPQLCWILPVWINQQISLSKVEVQMLISIMQIPRVRMWSGLCPKGSAVDPQFHIFGICRVFRNPWTSRYIHDRNFEGYRLNLPQGWKWNISQLRFNNKLAVLKFRSCRHLNCSTLLQKGSIESLQRPHLVLHPICGNVLKKENSFTWFFTQINRI